MSDDETRMFAAEIDVDTAEILDTRLEYGEKSRLIREFAQSLAYGDGYDERTALDIQIERLEEQLTDARETRREAAAQIETLEDRIESLKDKRQTKQTREERIDASLVPLESDLRAGGHIDQDHGGIESIAREYGTSSKAVWSRLKERNPDVPDFAFEDGFHSSQDWEGLAPEQQNLPVEQRSEVFPDE